MKFELRFALRYIFSKKSFNFITVISIVSFLGITIGVAAIIIVLSIFNGFRNFTEQQLVGFDPHIRIIDEVDQNYDANDLINKLKTIEEIKSIALTNETRVVGTVKEKIYVFNLIEINPKDFYNFYNLNDYIVFGNNILTKINNLPSIIIGAGISDKLNIIPGDTLTITTPKEIEKSIKFFSLPKSHKFFVSGIFQTNVKDFDFSYAFIDKSTLSATNNSKNYLDIKIIDLEKIDKVSNEISKIVPKSSEVLTWKELHKDLFKIMNFERYLSVTILSLIIMIAVFNVLASLTMTVIEKKRDIGILTSIGATEKQIKNIFLLQGSLIGILATLSGIILGLSFCFGQIHFQWFKLGGNNFLISAIPIKIQFFDIIMAAVISLGLTFVASIYPAKKAVKSISIENIREE